MASEWSIVRLGDYVDSSLGKMLDAQKNKGIPRPYLGNVNVRWGSFNLSNLSLMKFEEVEEERYEIRDGDLIVCEGGEPGRCAIWREQIPDMKIQKALHRVRPKFGLNNYYLFYWFMMAGRTGQLEPFFTGTTIKHLTGSALKELHLPLPPLPEQSAIAHILSSLDDKIELNRKRNETLEAMARALFKDWFVDFGPVRAKMKGRAPYLPAEIWDLFPDRLDEDGKPEGWVEKPLDEIADFLNGLALQKHPATNSDDCLPVIKIAELRNGISIKSDRASRDVPNKYIIKDGDFLFSWSGSLLAKFWTEGEGALNQHLFKVTSESFPIWFVSHWVHHHLKEFQSIAAAKATTMGHIKRGHLSSAMTTCPPHGSLQRMGKFIAPIVNQTIQNALESKSLAEIRDTLLPKLISGELRVTDIGQLMESKS